METHPLSALESFLRDKTRILVVTAPNAEIDNLAALSVIGKWIEGIGKTVTLVCPEKSAWTEPLRTLLPLKPALGAFRALHIRLPLEKTPLEEFSYDVRNQELQIELLPKNGAWSETDVKVQAGSIRFDALIAINIPQAALLQSLVPTETEWTKQLPSLHLTTKAKSDAWSTESISLLTTSSLCEELYLWMKEQNVALSPDITHNLLTGLIAATNGFRDERMQSRTLQVASELVERGADRQDIMNRLWRTMSLPALNVWGRALMRLSVHATLPFAHTILTEHDFLQAGAGEETIPSLGKYLLDRLPETKLCLVLSAWNGKRKAILFARQPFEANTVARWFHGHGDTTQAEWSIEALDLLEGQREILTVLERELPRFISSR